MIAKLPESVQNVVDAWPLIVGAIAAVGWLMRRQRAWTKTNISDPIAQNTADVQAVKDIADGMNDRQVSMEEIQGEMRVENAATRHLVAYHLGPNGTTKPLHRRVADIEQANGIAAPPPHEWITPMPWEDVE